MNALDEQPGMGMRAASGLGLAILCWVPTAFAADPPGTPKPSVGAPADKPGRNDPFGSQGEKAEETPSQAEDVAKAQKPKIVEIEISGNKHASDAHIKRHLLFAVGDDLDDDKIQLSRTRLLQLGPFSDVTAVAQKTDNENEVKVVIKVVERNTYTVTDLLYGTTSTTRFYAGVGGAAADLFNSGLSLSAAGVLGNRQRYAVKASLYAPDLNILKYSFVAGLQFILQHNLENACGNPACASEGAILQYRRLGGEADVGFRAGAYQRFLLGYRLEFVNAASNEAGLALPLSGPYIQQGLSRLSALIFGFDRDARNETFLPTRGSRVQAQVVLSSVAIGSAYEYAKFLVQYEQWVPQGGGRALRLDVALGLVQGNAPFFDRFYAADWSYFALGAATSRLVEMNFSPDPRYDTVLAVGGAEYDFPLWRTPVVYNFLKRGYIAVGARVVYTAATPGGPRTALSSIPFSADLAMRVDTPAGVFSLSLGYLADLIF